MKDKIKQTSIILLLVAIACFIKAYLDHQMILVLVGLLLVVLSVSRMLIIKKYTMDETYSNIETDSIMRYLNHDKISYVDMIELYKKGECEVLYDEIDGVLLKDKNAGDYLASATNKAGALDIINKLPQDYKTFVTHDAVFDEFYMHGFNAKESVVSYNHVYTKREQYVLKPIGIEIKELDDSYLKAIKEHYSLSSKFDDEYFLSQIKQGMLGAFIEDKLVGFIGMHDNYSLGMLEVFKGYEGRKIATQLQCSYVNYLLKKHYKGAIYSQVLSDNEVSLHLQKKLYFEKAVKKCIWYFN